MGVSLSKAQSQLQEVPMLYTLSMISLQDITVNCYLPSPPALLYAIVTSCTSSDSVFSFSLHMFKLAMHTPCKGVGLCLASAASAYELLIHQSQALDS